MKKKSGNIQGEERENYIQTIFGTLKNMSYAMKILKESFGITMFITFITMFSGFILSSNEEIIYYFPLILLMLPSLNSLVGDLMTVLISRLSSHFYLGSIPPEYKITERLKKDIIGLVVSLIIGLSILIIASIIYAEFMNLELNQIGSLIIVVVISIFIIIIGFSFILFIASVFLFNKGRDPINYLIAISTSMADLLTPLIMIVLIKIFIL